MLALFLHSPSTFVTRQQQSFEGHGKSLFLWTQEMTHSNANILYHLCKPLGFYSIFEVCETTHCVGFLLHHLFQP